jgi:hypothetical protein
MTKYVLVPRSKTKDLTYIKTRKQNRNVNQSKRRSTIGIDSETHDGDIFLIYDSDGNFLDHPNISFDAIVEFLFKHEGFGYFVIIYNMMPNVF